SPHPNPPHEPQGRARHSETVSKLRRDELHESPIVRKSPKKSGTRVTRPSELKVRTKRASEGGQSICLGRYTAEGGRSPHRKRQADPVTSAIANCEHEPYNFTTS